MRPASFSTVHHRVAGTDRVMSGSGARAVRALDMMVLLAELAMLAVFAVAGARLGSGAAAIALAVMLPLLVAILWGLCLAPRAGRRLPHPWRLAVKLVLMVAGAGLLAASGAVLRGVAFFIVASLLVTSAELSTPASPRS